MTVEEISMAAMNEEAIPYGEPPEDRALFGKLYMIYRQYRDGRITKETGAARKAEALFEHRRDRQRRQTLSAQARSAGALYIAIECVVSDYNLCPSRENADRMIETIYHVRKQCAAEFLTTEDMNHGRKESFGEYRA